MPSHLLLCALLSTLAVPASAQEAASQGHPSPGRVGLGLPALPPVTASSPLNSILFADRVHTLDQGDRDGDAGDEQGGPEGTGLHSAVLPSALTGTGFDEPIVLQLGSSYSAVGPPHPLLVAYHGFGSSAWSPSNLSTIDEECDARGWVYMAPTGLDDQLPGTPQGQQNTAAAIRWMVDTYNIDPDRIYMVGFSMGGGVCLSFAARHRDPDDIMIAAVGAVAAGLDWALTYDLDTPEVQALLEFIFGGPPATHAFFYQQASVLSVDSPMPHELVLVPALSMGSNLAPFPTYITYDDADTISSIPALNDILEGLITDIGGTVVTHVQTGTPVPHSWDVLDVVECLDFLDGKLVVRYPEPFAAVQDVGGKVAWLQTSQLAVETFTYVNGSIDLVQPKLVVDGLVNVDELAIDVGVTPLSGVWPAHFDLTNDDDSPLRAELTGFELSPSRLHQTVGAALVPLVDSDPTWSTVLTISPDPVGLEQPVSFQIDGPSTSQTAWLVISDQEFFTPVGSLVMTAFPVPPALLIYVGLDANGDLTLDEVIPNDPILPGLRLPTQVVTVNAGVLESVSNLWGFYIE